MVILKKLSERLSGLIKRPIIVLAAILVVLGLIFAVVIIKKVPEEKRLISLPPPSPTPVKEEIITPSTYATDSAILAIEEKLEVIEKDLLKTDLYETGLNPPVLDMEVEFKE